MEPLPVAAKASLAIDIKPQGSQQLVVLSVVGAITFFGVAMLFIYLKEPLWFVSLGVGLLMGGSALWCHAKSQPSLDRAAAGVTKITRDSKGTRIETNAITMGDETSGPMLERIISNVMYRQNVPFADGEVRSDLSVDTSAEAREAANLRVKVANDEAADLHLKALKFIAGSADTLKQPELDAPLSLPSVRPGAEEYR